MPQAAVICRRVGITVTGILVFKARSAAMAAWVLSKASS